jgi:hypothetical protein
VRYRVEDIEVPFSRPMVPGEPGDHFLALEGRRVACVLGPENVHVNHVTVRVLTEEDPRLSAS